MEQIADLDDSDAALTAAIRARLLRAPRDTLARWSAPRHALLARHLGFTPQLPVPVVNVIGDSHVLFFCGTATLNKVRFRRFGFFRPDYLNRGVELLPCFRVFHVGPATAWQAFEYRSTTRSREKVESLLRRDIRPGQPVLLSYGEIDCRCHIPRAVMTRGVTVAEAVAATVSRFMRLPLDLQARGFRVAVWGPPCVTASPEGSEDPNNPLPTVGPPTLRHDITQKYVRQLHAQTDAAGIPCVCLVERVLDPSTGAARAESQIDGCHLAPAMMPCALERLQAAGVLAITRRPV